MKVSNLERLLLENCPLFQEQTVSLVVTKGSGHSSSQYNSNIYLVDLSDGEAWMLGYLMEGSSTMEPLHSRSLLNVLEDPTVTGLHILCARVCIYRQENRLRPILYIGRCRPIYNGHTIAMSRQLQEIQTRPHVKHWLTKLEQGTQQDFLTRSVQDAFWENYVKHVEPHLERLINLFTGTWTKRASGSQVGTPLPSSLSPIQQHPSSTLGAHFPPTMTWEKIQELILDAFDSDDNDLFMDGFIPIPHNIWETPTVENNDTQLAAKQPPLAATETTNGDDWCQLFLDVVNESTEYDRLKKLNTAKMESMMTDTTLVLE